MTLLADLLSFGLNQGAAKKQTAMQQTLLDKNAAISRAEFDKRMAALGLSDARVTDLLKRQYGDTSKNADDTFAYLLDQAKQGFGEQQQLSDTTANAHLANQDKTFGAQMDALGGLMTAQKAARTNAAGAMDAETARQHEFQRQGDELVTALPGQIGYDAQTAGRGAAYGDRSALIEANTPGASPTPAFAGSDPMVAAAFADQQTRGSQAGLGDGLRAANLGSYTDASRGADRTLTGVGDNVKSIAEQAKISRTPLQDELGVGRLMGQDAQKHYDFAHELAQTIGDKNDQLITDRGTRTSGNMSDYRTNLKTAKDSFSQQISDMLNNYYGGQGNAEQSYITGITGDSTDLENKLVNLNNFKMGATKVVSPAASFVSMLDNAATQAAKAMAGG